MKEAISQQSSTVQQKTQSTVQAMVELGRIVELFQSQELVGRCTKALISGPSVKPSSRWSLGNFLLMWIQGTLDARGFRQWIQAGRTVMKGKKAIYILAPLEGRVVEKDEETGKEEVRYFIRGFRGQAVFRVEDTKCLTCEEPWSNMVQETNDKGEKYWKYYPNERRKECPKCREIESQEYTPMDPPPLLDVFKRYGFDVKYQALSKTIYGVTLHETKKVLLQSEDWTVVFHELAHVVHRSFEPKSPDHMGQDPEAECIAALVSAVLCRMYGREDDVFAWRYIAHYAGSKSPETVGRMCVRILSKAQKIVELILGNERPKDGKVGDAPFGDMIRSPHGEDVPDNWKDVKAPKQAERNIVTRYPVPSDSTPGKEWEVAEWSDGTFSCNCPS